MDSSRKRFGFGDKKRKGFERRPMGSNFGDDRKRGSFGSVKNDGDREMYHSVCAKCQKPCRVPFRPTGEKPVYCSDCFEPKQRDSKNFGPRKSFERRGERNTFREQRQPQNTSFLERHVERLTERVNALSATVERLTVSFENVEKQMEKLAKNKEEK